MLNRIVLIVACLLAATPITPPTQGGDNGEPAANLDPGSILKELGAKVRTIPDTKDECQVLLKAILAWQESKLKEVQALKVGVNLRITEPPDGACVSERPTVVGTVGDPNAKVWVVVHPMEVSDYWVGPSASVKPDGSWKAVPYIGRPGGIDVGKNFEIRAIARPRVELREGVVLSGWPEAEWNSQIVELTRE